MHHLGQRIIGAQAVNRLLPGRARLIALALRGQDIAPAVGEQCGKGGRRIIQLRQRGIVLLLVQQQPGQAQAGDRLQRGLLVLRCQPFELLARAVDILLFDQGVGGDQRAAAGIARMGIIFAQGIDGGLDPGRGIRSPRRAASSSASK